MLRGGNWPPGAYHLVVHVCLFNSSGEMLIQQRQPFKEGWSNMWDVTVGGSALAGETSQAAATRELQEELGYRVDLTGERPHLTINFDVGFDDFYLVKVEPALNELHLQPTEVQAVRWATKRAILSMIDSGEFIPYHRSLIALLFD
ncbi:MAG: NUDIX hydrolase, partial [Anaerolineae bacterium]